MIVKLYNSSWMFLGHMELTGFTSEDTAASAVVEALTETKFMEVKYKNEMEYVRSSEIVRFKICEQ